MKRIGIILLLLIIIALSGFFSFLYISFNLINPENRINSILRKRVIYYSPIRKLLRLHQVGDARFEYMHQTGLPIAIHLYYQEGASLSEKTKENILSRMQFITHKYVPGIVEGPTILQNIPEKVDIDDIERLRTTYSPPFSLFSKTVPLNIFVLDYYTPHPSYAGLVEDDHSIFIFKKAIENVSETADIIPSMEISTILHEFAHLGGAEHIDTPSCILLDTVENLDFYNKISAIRDSYCEEDLNEIENALQL